MSSFRFAGWVLLAAGCGRSQALQEPPPSALERLGWEHTTAGGLGVNVYVPSTAPSTGRPLMVVLHGCAQTAGDLKSRVDWEAISEAFGAVITLPNVPNGGKYLGCWNYYGSNHSRNSGDAGKILDLVEDLQDDPDKDIDANRTSIAGFSSGAGMAMVMGCLAPDVFSGVGIAAGPTVGTSAFQISTVGTTLARGTGTCLSLAGSHVDAFATQLVGIIAGSNDYTVAQGYADLNADIFGGIYADVAGAGLGSAGFPVTALEGYQPQGTGTLFSDTVGPRVSLVKATGMGHAWPAGTGPGGEIAFIASAGVDFGWTLQDFFAQNHRRGPATEPIPGDDDPPDDDPQDPVDPPEDPDPPDDVPCESWVDSSEDDINGHLSRYDVYPPGYGVADVTYVDLLDSYGVFGPFTLYLGVDGDWYHDPTAVPANEDCP